MLRRTLDGIVLAKLGKISTIRLETGETRKVLVPCLSRIGDRVHVYIDYQQNNVVKVSTAECPDHWDGDVEPEPVDAPDETEDIPHLDTLGDREVLGRQGSEEPRGQESQESQEFREYQEVLGRPRSGEVGSLEFLTEPYENESMLDDIFEEDFLTQVGEPSHKFGDLI